MPPSPLLRRPTVYFLSLFILLLSLASLPVTAAQRIYLGIDVLAQAHFKPLLGKRVGLLTHPAGVNRDGKSTIDVLREAPKVQLVALFGPEHGIYGDEKAETPIADRIDPRTGLPVYSLYGRYRKPTPAMLKGLDVLVIDLQDLGVRSYTYISCMRYAMEACFENGVEVMILDRPNPLGGLKVDGPSLDKEWMSYVGALQVPYVHGLTIGELARMAKKKPGWLNVAESEREHGKLTIVPMHGWHRDMLWTQTGLRWVPTSPAIPDLSAAMGYAMTGLGAQLGGFSHGYGTAWGFRLLSFPGKSSEELYAAFNACHIPGLDYKRIRYTDIRGREKEGLYVLVTDWDLLRPTELSFHMMRLAAQWQTPNPFTIVKHSLQNLYNKHVGSTAWWEELTQRGPQARVELFVAQWADAARAFQQYSRPYYLYH